MIHSIMQVEFISKRQLYRGEVMARCALCDAMIAFTSENRLFKLSRSGDAYIGTPFSNRLPSSCQDILAIAAFRPCKIEQLFAGASSDV